MLPRHTASGFTLIEAVLAAAIGLLLLLGVYTVFDMSTATYVRSANRQETQQLTRQTVGEITRQIRTLGFFPENFPPPGQPVNPPANTFPIHIATKNALAVYGDLDGSGTSVVWLYCQNGNLLIAKKGAANAPGAADYTCTGEDWVLAENVTNLTFAYFDATDTLITGAGAAGALDGIDLSGGMPNFAASFAQRSSIRKIGVTVQVLKQSPGQPPAQTMLTTTIRPRNLVF